MKNFKRNVNGITLVALVITIIILLILAGVTIAALSGDSGILHRGSEAVVNTNIENVKDGMQTAVQECLADYYNARYVTLELSTDANKDDVTYYICKRLADTPNAQTVLKQSDYDTKIASISPGAQFVLVWKDVQDANDQPLTLTFDATKGTYAWSNQEHRKTNTSGNTTTSPTREN